MRTGTPVNVDLQSTVEDLIGALERSNALVSALGHVAARLETTHDPTAVMQTLGAELHALHWNCLVALLDPGAPALVVHYWSAGPLGILEKFLGIRVIGFRLPSDRFILYDDVIVKHHPCLVGDWMSVIAPLLPKTPRLVIEYASRFAGVTAQTRVAYLPLRMDEQVLGVLGIWSDDLQDDDLVVLSLFAGEVAVALENARMFGELERQRAELHTLSGHLVTTLEDERRRIARELHDEAGQLLYALRLHLDVLARSIPDDQLELLEQTGALRLLAEEARLKIRALSHELRPATLDELGLVPALRQLITDFGAQGKLQATFDTTGAMDRLGSRIETACYRIVQEALTNTMRHAQARHVCVRLQADEGQVRLEIADDGQGFNPGRLQSHAGVGLLGIRERAAGLHGELAIESAPGHGTRLVVSVPMLDEEAA